MRTLVELVEKCIGSRDPGALSAAVGDSGEDLWDRLRTEYGNLKLRPVPQKKHGEFVPSWRLDIIDLANPYGYDAYFVARAILYSHRVVLFNHLAQWIESEIPPATLKEDLHKIMWCGALERSKLLYYADPLPSPVSTVAGAHVSTFLDLGRVVEPGIDVSDPGLTDREYEQYFLDYMAPRGRYIEVEDWDSKTGPAFLARNIAAVELMHGLPAVRALLDWQRHYRHQIDLYVPGHPIYRDVSEWLVRRDGFSVLGSATSTPGQSALSALWSLPTPSAEAYSQLTIRDLLAIREERCFALWRDSLSASVQALAIANAGRGGENDVQREFVRTMTSERERLLAELGRIRPFRAHSGPWGSFGLSLLSASAATFGVTSLFPTESALAATLGGGAAMVGAYAPKAPSLVRDILRSSRAKEAVENHFALFGID